MKCIICGRTKQGAMVCLPCRQAADRLIRNGFTSLEVFIVMMYPKHRRGRHNARSKK